VRAHLEARAVPGSVRRDRVFVCSRCGYQLPADLVRRRQGRGDREMRCPDCEQTRISLLDRRARLDRTAEVLDMNASADAGRDRAAATATIRGKEETQDYDVFLSYNSKDRDAVREIAGRLRSGGLLPWFDTIDLPPGERWQGELERQIGRARCGAVFLGPHGLGPWQTMEQQALIEEHTRRAGFRLVPVLLAGTPAGAELSRFLGQWHAVDFRAPEPDPFEQLRWAITGERPPAAYLG
jgi:DNA-directed RNA polymerase subunit RPC12/RpoP